MRAARPVGSSQRDFRYDQKSVILEGIGVTIRMQDVPLAAARLMNRAGFLAHLIGRGDFDVVTIQKVLGCSAEAALRLCLCRAPRPEHWQADVEAIAEHAGIDSGVLMALLAASEHPGAVWPATRDSAAAPRLRYVRAGKDVRLRFEVLAGPFGWQVWEEHQQRAADGKWILAHARSHGPYEDLPAAVRAQDGLVRAAARRQVAESGNLDSIASA